MAEVIQLLGFYYYSKAITEMNGHIIGSKPIYVSWAMNKEDRKDQIAQQSFWRGVSGLRVQKVNYPKALKFIT